LSTIGPINHPQDRFFGGAYNMETPFTSAGFKPEAAFADAAQRFFEMLKTFGVPAAGARPDWSSLGAPLARQFEQWLRMSQSAGPWFAAAGAPAAASPASGANPAWSFGPLPLGPAAASGGDAQRIFELLGKLSQLQGQLAVHWGEVANTAARRFIERLGSNAAAPATVEQALKLYELWVACAEEAYAATAHKADFSRLQAEVANTSAALLVQQRRHAETLVRAFGLPTRNEVDALYAQVNDLRRQLAELAAPPASKAAPRKRATRATARSPAKRAGAARSRR
jgi:polyhydroxyalkanoate synthesis regulator phasin